MSPTPLPVDKYTLTRLPSGVSRSKIPEGLTLKDVIVLSCMLSSMIITGCGIFCLIYRESIKEFFRRCRRWCCCSPEDEPRVEEVRYNVGQGRINLPIST